MAVTVGDLKDQTGTPGPDPILYCKECGGEYSANKGDYFQYRNTYPFFCCDKPMQLVRKITVYQPVET